jgi:hypothetical protein
VVLEQLVTLEVGVLESGLISVVCRSSFNEYPLGQSSTTSGKNLANNIVIPKFSRINDIRFVVNEAFDTAGFDMQIGANVAQASGATLNSLDLDYFAGDADNDVKSYCFSSHSNWNGSISSTDEKLSKCFRR